MAFALTTLAGCHRTQPQELAPRAGETLVTLAGTRFGIVLPPPIVLREDDPAVTGEPTTHEELADGFAAFQAPRRASVAEHATSWFLTVQPGEEYPATRDDAIHAALQVAPGQPPAHVLGIEELDGGFLITTAAADRLTVHAWRRHGSQRWQCGGEDFRDAKLVASPSWLEDHAQVERARLELEAPCRTARVVLVGSRPLPPGASH